MRGKVKSLGADCEIKPMQDSDHQLLAEPAKTQLLAALGEAVDELGGSITAHYSTVLLLAQR